MVSSDVQRLEQQLVRLLADYPSSTAGWLHQQCRAARSCTVQGVYHELRKLQKRGVVVKVGDCYSLSLSWAFEFVQFADRIYDNYVASASHLEILPEHNSSKTWHFSNLLRLDDLWVQAMVAIFTCSDAKEKFGWNPHPWFYFAQIEKVAQYYRLFKQRGWRYYSTIGGDTFLDRHYAESMDASFFEYRTGQAPVFDDMSRYYALIGDYIITVKLDAATTGRIEELFRSIRCLADADYQSVSRVLNSRGTLSLKLEHNPQKVKKYVRKFKEFFGV
ncbi:MAG: hypothetical protein KDD69_03285 [Bdellovibrionales bacterium]|nr:hypothetical protein [Bdellovibrionales bacterium]